MTNIRIKLITFILAALMGGLSANASAGIFEDIFNVATAARDRAIQARDRAKEARDNAAETRDQMRDARVAFTNDIRDAINEATEDLRTQIAENIAGRQAWLGNDCDVVSDCGRFRADIVGLINDLATTSNALFIATELGIEIDGSRLVTVLETIPGRLLYPLYRAFSEELNIFESDFVLKLGEAADALAFLRDSVPESTCDLMLADRDLSAERIKRTKVTGLGIKLVGKIFEAVGTKEIQKEGAVWGWVGVALKNNRLKNVGIKFTGLGEGLTKYAGVASTKLLRCIIIDDHEQIIASIGDISLDVSNVDAPISTRSSQDSVDALGTALAGLALSMASLSTQSSVDALAANVASLDFSDLDAPVSSRASQASVDSVALAIADLDLGNLDAPVSSRASQMSITDLGEEISHTSDSARGIEIERHLAEKDKAISSYYLPEAFGGSLEVVRDVVETAMARNEAAGISLGNAPVYLDRGDQDFGVGDYKGAYKNYEKAYKQVISNDSDD